MAAMTFFERLAARARSSQSLLCVGLDPRVASASELVRECRRLIDATIELALCYKPNTAFFEAHGTEGWAALTEVIRHCRAAGAPVLLDAKRGDIGSTAEAYATAAFGELHADAVTLHPWLGLESLTPFLAAPYAAEKAVFALVRTSNPDAAELQDVVAADGRPMWAHVASAVGRWRAQYPNLGVVVGATQPAILAAVRAILPDAWILAPGVGTQGGKLDAALAAGLRADGLGLIVPVSRQLSDAPDPARAARELVETMRDALATRRGASA